MYAGFCNVTGDYAAVMDADMQDPPALLPQMLDILENQEYDSGSVSAVQQEKASRLIRSRRFGKKILPVWSIRISDADIVDGARDSADETQYGWCDRVEMESINRFSKGFRGDRV